MIPNNGSVFYRLAYLQTKLDKSVDGVEAVVQPSFRATIDNRN
jgi:hypothetical protein